MSFDFDYTILFYSDSWKKEFLNCYNKCVWIGTNLLEVLKEFNDEYPKTKAALDKVLAGNTFTDIQEFGTNGDFYEVRYHPLIQSGTQIGATIIATLITEVEHRNRELNFVENKLVESVLYETFDTNIFCVLDTNYRFVTFNRSFADEYISLFGVEPKQGASMKELIAHVPEQLEKLLENWDRALKGETFSCVHELGNDKYTNYYEIQYKPFYISKKLYCASAIVRSITKQVETEQKLRNRLDLLFDASEFACWTLDLKTKNIISDRKHKSLFRIDSKKEKVNIEEFYSHIHPDDLPRIRQEVDACVLNKTFLSVEFRVIYPDQSVHWIVGKGRLFSDHTGEPMEIIGVNWEITTLKQIMQEREEALNKSELMQKKSVEEAEENQQRLEEFINTICHEVRNPLNGLIGATVLIKDAMEALRRSENSEVYYKEIAGHITTLELCSEQQKIVVDDVLDLSKLEHDNLVLDESAFYLESAIENVIHMFRAKILLKKVELKMNRNSSIPFSSVVLKTDKHRLKQILINLLSNAIKFTDYGSIVLDINVVEQDDYYGLLIQVQDTGIGMTLEEVNGLFKKFYQADLKKSKNGSGLGLVITKKLVERMGGKINVESTKGIGSTFKLNLPCKKAVSSELETTSPNLELEKMDVENKLILIVEDNIINQKILINYLDKFGLCYQVANNGVEALQKCKYYHFSVILMDIEMPVMNGIEATMKLRADTTSQNNQVCIIGLSGNALRQNIEEARKAGMTDYLTKPYHREDLLTLLQKYLPPT